MKSYAVIAKALPLTNKSTAATSTTEDKLAEYKTHLSDNRFRKLFFTGNYVDKTLLIKVLIENDNKIVKVFNFPSRSGKSINLKMLEQFFGSPKEGKNDIFAKLNIGQLSDYMQYQGRYSVIYLSWDDFAGEKQGFYAAFSQKMSQLYQQHAYVCESLEEWDKNNFLLIQSNKETSKSKLGSALKYLMQYITIYNRKRGQDYAWENPIVLIDTFDTLIPYLQAEENFISGFFGRALKGNDSNLRWALVVGTGDECLKMMPNNVKYYMMQHKQYSLGAYSNYCGFTSSEVQALLVRNTLVDKSIRPDFYDQSIHTYLPEKVMTFIHENTGKLTLKAESDKQSPMKEGAKEKVIENISSPRLT